MKVLRSIVLLLTLAGLVSMTTQKKTRVIFFGDSITEQATKDSGFIIQIGNMLKYKGVDAQYDLIGAGVSGNKVYDLYLRMDSDVVMKDPNVVFIYIGVNDVWHKATSGTGTDAVKFERFYTAIIRKLQQRNIRVILCTPATIGEKKEYTNQQDGDMNYYSEIIRNLAKRFNCQLIDLRSIFHEYDAQNNPDNKDRGILTRDGVHLNGKGNTLVAQKMLDALMAK
jgi:lysophospholipase L1-like esterase